MYKLYEISKLLQQVLTVADNDHQILMTDAIYMPTQLLTHTYTTKAGTSHNNTGLLLLSSPFMDG